MTSGGNFMTYTATELRKNIYTVLDSVLETGNPVEIVRNGKQLRIVPEHSSRRLDRLENHDVLVGNSEDLPDIHWEESWSGQIE
jgi:prevent-host-death family protein